MSIGKQIKYYRQRKNVRQEDLADFLGVSCQAVSKWETESNLPDITLLPRLAVFFGVAIDDLFRVPTEDELLRIENALDDDGDMEHCTFEHYREFLENLTHDAAHAYEATVLLSRLYNHHAQRDHAIAARYAEKAVRLEPERKDGWVPLIEAHKGVCGDEWWDNHFALIQFCEDFLREHPRNFECLYALIENLLADKRFDEAAPYVQQLRTLPGREQQTLIYEGDIQLGRGDLSGAIALWNRAVTEHPTVWQAYCSRADRMKKLGRYEEALQDYEQCFIMQKPPRISDGLYSRAQLFEQLHRYEEAIREHERILLCLQEEFNFTDGQEALEEQRREIKRLRQLCEKE